jgi:FtsZ-binding cell division protein ZapB
LDSAKIEIDGLKIENKNLSNQLSNLREINKNNESNKDSVLDAYKSEISSLNVQINKLEILNQKFKNDIKQFEERKD